MKILVTGGAGFIGSRIAHQLVKEGHDVTVFDNLSEGHRADVPKEAKFIEADLLDAEAMKTAVAGQNAVVHLAAQARVPESVADPQKAFDNNLVGGQNLLEAMRATGVKRLVHSSTAAVYGTPKRVPINEDDATEPINPYGATKFAFEQLLRAYHTAYGFHVTMFRYFNPYGPTEAHVPETHAIPNFIRAALAGEPVQVYWDGDQERDFFYVADLASAHVAALSHDGFHYYNLGSGRAVKVRDVVELVFKLTGRRTHINNLGERPGDAPRLLADITKVRRELGWQPKTSLEDGLHLTIEAFQSRAK